jgi:hypothetical protein
MKKGTKGIHFVFGMGSGASESDSVAESSANRSLSGSGGKYFMEPTRSRWFDSFTRRRLISACR